MKKINYPRILVISAAPIGFASATGITLANLFSDWPRDSIAQIYDDVHVPDRLICNNFRRFSSIDIPLVRKAKSLLGRFRLTPRNSFSLPPLPNVEIVSGSISHGFLGAIGDVIDFQLPNEISDWVSQYKPDVIYSVLGSVRMMNIALKLHNKFDTPIVPHFMDDWPNTVYKRSWRLSVPRAILTAKLKSILAYSPKRLTICEDMANEYSSRYGGHFDYFMNCIEPPDKIAPLRIKTNELVRFGFVGGLHLNRWRSLLSVISALQSLKDQGKSVTLDIYAPQKDIKTYSSIFKGFSVVGVMSTLKAQEVCEKLEQFEVLVHVESFEPTDSLYTRLSISTKIPQYMASGRPILAFGPSTLSSIRYIRDKHAGSVVDAEDGISALTETCDQLIRLPELRKTMGSNGFKVATALHNSMHERERFRKILFQAAQ